MIRAFFAFSLLFLSSAQASHINRDNQIVRTTVKDVSAEYELMNEIYSDKIPGALILATPTPTPNPRPTATPKPGATPGPSASPSATPDPNSGLNPPAPGSTNTPTVPNTMDCSTAKRGSLAAKICTVNNTVSGVAVTIDQLITLGQRVWQFVIDNKPNATFQILNSSIVPEGISSWTQLTRWQHPVTKVYRVEFKNALGMTGSSFDYRIVFVPGGTYKGKGKFLGNISFVPMNIQLHTGRSLDVKAELSTPLNYGTETDPVAAVQLMVSWSTPTFTGYQMHSAQYFIYGDGQIQDDSSGN